MGRSRYKIHEDHNPYFMTSSVIEGIPLFKDPVIARIILDALVFLQKEREVELNAYVIMENHIHFIAKGDQLAKHVQNLKSYTAHQIVEYLEKKNDSLELRKLKRSKQSYKIESVYQIWQEGFHPKQLFTVRMFAQKLEYIHFNPVKRGYVDEPVHWRYSSARNYLGTAGLIPVTIFGG